MRKLYIECYEGISGENIAGAFLKLCRNGKETRGSVNSVFSDKSEYRAGEIVKILEMSGTVTSGAVNYVKKITEFFGGEDILPRTEIVNIVCAAVCADGTGIRDVIIPVLYEGRGKGIPNEKTAEILSKSGIGIHISDDAGELITPVGAAIAAGIVTDSECPYRFKLVKVVSASDKEGRELRLYIIDCGEKTTDCVYRLETNIDDCCGEAMGYVMDRLLKNGARDVSYTPLYMKKNRPAYQLNVICGEEDIGKMEDIIFSDTTTIGIRRVKMERTILEREIRNIPTEYGDIQVKVCTFGENRRWYIEYESVVRVCGEYGISYRDAYSALTRICEEKRKNDGL